MTKLLTHVLMGLVVVVFCVIRINEFLSSVVAGYQVCRACTGVVFVVGCQVCKSCTGVLFVVGYQVCKACNITATWSHHESSSLDELLRQYWASVIISHLSSRESLDGVAFKGDVYSQS